MTPKQTKILRHVNITLTKRSKVTSHQKDLIIGTLLGDGNLSTNSPQGVTWRYRALHKGDHKEYLFYKYKILKNFVGKGPKFYEFYDDRTNKFYNRWFFNTRSCRQFQFFGKLFYFYSKSRRKWVKRVPINIIKFLTPRALAYWYMDDGALKQKGKSNAMRICSEGFKKHEVERLIKALKIRYKLECTISPFKKKDKFRIFIPEKSSNAFRDIIKPYLIPCMSYKVSDGNKGHL